MSQDFAEHADLLMDKLPKDKQVLMFSATFPVSIKSFLVSLTYFTLYFLFRVSDELSRDAVIMIVLTLSSVWQTKLNNYEVINLMSELTLKGITQYYAYVPEAKKVHCLNTLFRKLNVSQCKFRFAYSVVRKFSVFHCLK